MTSNLKRQWSSVSWRKQAETWIKQSLRANEIVQTGPVEQQRIRFWSTQLTVKTDKGRLWFKANNPDQAFEANLISELAAIVPDNVVIPLAVDARPRLAAVAGSRPDHVCRP